MGEKEKEENNMSENEREYEEERNRVVAFLRGHRRQAFSVDDLKGRGFNRDVFPAVVFDFGDNRHHRRINTTWEKVGDYEGLWYWYRSRLNDIIPYAILVSVLSLLVFVFITI